MGLRLRRWIEPVRRGLAWGGENPIFLWTWLTLGLVLFTLLSMPIGVGAVRFSGRIIDVAGATPGLPAGMSKEVGYLAAVNWSLYGALILPLMLTLLLRMWSTMPTTLAALAANGMVRNDKFERVPEADLDARWARVQRQCAGIFVVILLAVMAVAMLDWWAVVAKPIIWRSDLAGVPLGHASKEFDWSIACLYPGSGVNCGVLGVYGFVGYAFIAGFCTATAFATLICGMYFIAFLCGHIGKPGERITLIAAPCGESDKLGGFGAFARFFGAFIGASVTVVVACLLMVMQNAYLRDPKSESLYQFLKFDIDELLRRWDTLRPTTAMAQLQDLWGWLLAPNTLILSNLQTVLGTVMLTLTCFVSLAASWLFLGLAARSARDRSFDNASRLAKECRTTVAKLKERLDDMEFWPVGWLNLTQLILIMGCFAAAIISYRLIVIGLVLLVLLMVKSLKDALGDIFKRGRTRRR